MEKSKKNKAKHTQQQENNRRAIHQKSQAPEKRHFVDCWYSKACKSVDVLSVLILVFFFSTCSIHCHFAFHINLHNASASDKKRKKSAKAFPPTRAT
jgi:hypothetical protein